MTPNLLSELDEQGIHWKICVRVSRMWLFRGPKDDEEIKHMDLVVIDKKHNAMYVQIPPSAVPYVKDKVEEGGVYNITKFLIIKAKTAYKVVDNPLMIWLNERAIIDRVYAEPPSFPRYVYSLVPFESLEDFRNKNERFLDVIGQVTAVSNAAIVTIGNYQQVKRTITLKNLSGEKVEVWLLGSRATEFPDQRVYKASETQPIIAIFVRLLMKGSGHKRFLSGNSACRWYINEDTTEINSFYACLGNEFEPVEKILLENEGLMQTEVQELPAIELNKMCPFQIAEHKFKCTTTIVKFNEDQGWYYPVCRKCHKRVFFHGSKPECSNCKLTGFQDRYKLSLVGNDTTDDIDFVVFGEYAQRLIGKLLKRLQELYHKKDTPPEIAAIVGQKYTFIIKLSVRKSATGAISQRPSFEILHVLHQFGRQRNILQTQAFTTGTIPRSINLTPLTPIKSEEMSSTIPAVHIPDPKEALSSNKRTSEGSLLYIAFWYIIIAQNTSSGY
ncbi:hypothetical protein ACP4OV_015839 [Aristida adscensionis]